MAINIFKRQNYPLAIVLAMLCFFFPYHTAFISLAMLGALHIFIEVSVWNELKRIGILGNQYFGWVMASAVCLSLFSLFPLVWNFLGQPPIAYFSSVSLSVFAIWCFGLIEFHLLRFKSFALAFVSFLIFLCFLVFAWQRPSLNYFFLVHIHNLLPWFILYRITNKRSIFLLMICFSVLIPIFTFSGIELLRGTVSDFALPQELEQEIFHQVIHFEFPWVSGTKFLGYFAYQQCLHYFLWILVIPKLINKDIKFSSIKGNVMLSLLLIIVFVLFLIYPIDFRRIYFAFGFFHIAIEFPLLIAILFPNVSSNGQTYLFSIPRG